MTALGLVVVGVLLLALSPWTLYRLSTRIFRRRRRRDDTQLFQDCRHTAPNRLFRMMPSPPRCAVCFLAFGGLGKVFRITPSRKNPKLCDACFERAPVGGYPMEIGVLFADVRGFTTLAEHQGAEEVATLLNRFYRVATDVLVERFAIVDKLIGDEVMALFLPQFPTLGERTCEVMVETAEELLRGVGYRPGEKPWLPLGVGVNFGPAFVGNVGTGEVKDFTAIGDVVNVAERLQSKAGAGEIVASEVVYERLAARYPEVSAVTLNVKGREKPVRARVLVPALADHAPLR
jgi:adenylate cyclase